MSQQSSLDVEEKLKLESWGLPKYILKKYTKKGLVSMFPWQLECLTSGNVLEGGNLVYSAPTSAGKTLIAEILTIQTVLERKKKVIIILPFVSVVREKMLYFQDLLSGSGIRVEGFMGSYNPPGGFRAVHVAICTIEKANTLINRLLEEDNFDNIGCVVVDELHLLGDPHRGYLLELLLTKLRYISKKGLCPPIQVVGMSATLPNLDVLASWLEATLYKTEFRPIPLVEYMKVDRMVFKTPDLTSSEDFIPEFTIDKDPGDVIYLCIDTILKGFSVLVFCPTKNWCESLALQISGEVKRLGCGTDEVALELRKQLNSEAISDTLEQLKNSPVGLESVLGKCISFGVAYHHAGLTLDERDIVEGGFRNSVLRVLVATSTLSSGVNLPARRVIIRSPSGFNGRVMDILTYKQMVGRAGRMGKDTAGESFLLCTEENKSQGQQLVTSELPSVESCLGSSDLSNSLKRAVLEVIASGLISSIKEVECYTNCTLLAAYENPDRIQQAVEKCIQYLTSKGFIEVTNLTEISASSLAEACLSASMTPDQGLALLAELDKARKCFVLDSDLHAIYQVTPFSVSNQWAVDWMKAFSMWENLPKNVQKVGHMVGVEDRFLIQAMRGTMNFQGENQIQKIAVHKRFFTALALQDLINEIPLMKVAEKYGVNKGVLQSLQQSASTFSGMVTNFCRKLGWSTLEVVVSQLGQRIQFGAQRDLLDLLRLECMTGAMARGLHKSGVTTVSELAQSSVRQISSAIRKSLPYSSTDDEQKRKQKRDIYLPGRPGLTEHEAADLFIKEARTFLMREMGVEHVDWGSQKTTGEPSEIEDMTTAGPSAKTLSRSGSSSLDLSVTSADFDNLNEEDQGLKIGLKEPATDKLCADDAQTTSQPAPATDQSPREAFHDRVEEQQIEVVDPPENLPTNSSIPESEGIEDKVDENVDDVEEDDNDVHSKFSTLLDISNPCIPKIDKSLASSTQSRDEEDFLNNDLLPASLEGRERSKLSFEGLFGVSSLNQPESCATSLDTTDPKDATDYANLEFSNFSKAFSKSFNADSPLNALEIKPLLKSSTPVHKPPAKLPPSSNLQGDEAEPSGLDESQIKEETFKTPVIKMGSEGCQNPSTSYGSPKLSESDADMFGDSCGADMRLSSSMLCAINSDQPLEEFDSNWGGDSILLASQVIEIHKDKSLPRTSVKRGLEDYSSRLEVPAKRLCTRSADISAKNSGKRTRVSNYFAESLALDTQAMNVVDENSSPIVIFAAENKDIAPVNSPPPATEKGPVVTSQGRNSLSESFLAEAFQDSFKASGEKVARPATPEMFESPVQDPPPKDVLKEFPNTGLVSFNEKGDSVESKKQVNQITSVSSPRKVKTPLVSPQKYPAVGVSVVKCSKSPDSQSKTPQSRREPSKTGSCKKSLLMTNGVSSVPEEPSGSETTTAKLPLVSVSPSRPKRFKKFKSETWGKHAAVEEMATVDSYEPNSQPLASEVSNVPVFSGKIDLSKIGKTVNVCESWTSSEEFFSKAIKWKETAFVLETSQCLSEKSKIGLKILRSKAQDPNPDFHYNNVAIIGMYFTVGEEVFKCCLKSSKCACVDSLKSLFRTRDLTIVGYDLAWQVKLMYQACGFVTQCRLWDVCVADWLLNPRDGKTSLKQLSKEFLSSEELAHSHLQGSPSAIDLIQVWGLKKTFSTKLEQLGLLEPFLDTEMPMRLLLVYMELSGMPFDQNIATQLWNCVRETMSELEEQIFVKAKRRFRLSSRNDLKKVKDSLNIRPGDQHPLLGMISNWRKLSSLKTRSLSPLLMTPLSDGRCRSQCSSFTVTGRIVMHEPNLQHVPRDFSVNNRVFSLRSSFVAKPGNMILSADYSQLELRILAHFSQDPDLLSSINKEADVFVSIAAKWNQIPHEDVTDDIRQQTKQIIYGIIYGMGDRALGEALGVDPPEAAMLASKFRQSYPGVQRFIQNCISDCRKTGRITTLTGRVRRLKGINSPNKAQRAQAERQAVNSTIQGSAADIAKSATVRIESELGKAIPRRGSVITPLSASHLILHLHDELMYEVSSDYVHIVKNIVKTEMTNAVKLKVPLPVVIKIGPSWGQLKKV